MSGDEKTSSLACVFRYKKCMHAHDSGRAMQQIIKGENVLTFVDDMQLATEYIENVQGMCRHHGM